MGCRGPVDHEADLVHRSAILPSWGGIRPGAEMTERLDVPVHIENDANLGALAEVTMGAARGVGDAIYLMIAAGIGAGVIVDGAVVHGAGGTAGELGHVLVDDNGPICRCGNRGCLETLAAGPAIVDLLRRTYGDDLTLDDVLAHVARGRARRRCARSTDAGHAVGLALAGAVQRAQPRGDRHRRRAHRRRRGAARPDPRRDRPPRDPARRRRRARRAAASSASAPRSSAR